MLYLGFDSSTQGLKATIIDTSAGDIVATEAVKFGGDLPQYHAPDGFITDDTNPLLRHSDPLMWLDALDLLCQQLKAKGAPLAQIAAISGSGQQHGSVYLSRKARTVLQSLTTAQSLACQLRPTLTRKTAPIWMDRTTADECDEMTKRFGKALQQRTGSPAIERFTGAQIRRFWKESPDAYGQTAHIQLVSSFMCSVLAGTIAPVDYGDGAGMNLLDLQTLQWDREIVEYMAPNLADKLPAVAPNGTIVGRISPYFHKYGFNPNAKVMVWSGDNPCSLVGVGAAAAGTAGISLGTSDTVFAGMRQYSLDPEGYGHIMGNPAGGFFSLICFTNGSLARQRVKEDCKVDWHFFDEEACNVTQPGNGGRLMLPYFEPESTPLRLNAAPKYNFDHRNASSAERIRALLESQALSMRLHSQWLDEKIVRIRLTGGASKSVAFQQIIADVFQAQVELISVTDAAPLGAAIIAAAADGTATFQQLWEKFCRPAKVVSPRSELAEIYDRMMTDFRHFEKN